MAWFFPGKTRGYPSPNPEHFQPRLTHRISGCAHQRTIYCRDTATLPEQPDDMGDRQLGGGENGVSHKPWHAHAASAGGNRHARSGSDRRNRGATAGARMVAWRNLVLQRGRRAASSGYRTAGLRTGPGVRSGPGIRSTGGLLRPGTRLWPAAWRGMDPGALGKRLLGAGTLALIRRIPPALSPEHDAAPRRAASLLCVHPVGHLPILES